MRSPKFTESLDESRQLSCAYQPTYGFDSAYVALVASLEVTGNPIRNAAQLWPMLPAVRQSSCWQVNAFVKLNEPDVTPGSPPLRRWSRASIPARSECAPRMCETLALIEKISKCVQAGTDWPSVSYPEKDMIGSA